jgi:hypothetical protein
LIWRSDDLRKLGGVGGERNTSAIVDKCDSEVKEGRTEFCKAGKVSTGAWAWMSPVRSKIRYIIRAATYMTEVDILRRSAWFAAHYITRTITISKI